MQNGVICGHFRVSYNIESSTILMTLIDKNFLKLSKICHSCLSRYEHLHCFVQVHFKISMNMHQSKLTVASGTTERSFSVLRYLKNYVRSTMKNDRLSSLGLVHIHRDFEVDLYKAMEVFVSAKTRMADFGQF
jgi:translation elongation factor EF-G